MSVARSDQEIGDFVQEVLAPAHFFLGGTWRLTWEHVPEEEIPWEIFQGRLLDAAQTRERRVFTSWNLYRDDAGTLSLEPLLSVKFAKDEGRLYVVRAIHSYAWEGYHAGDNVYLSREVKKWVRELAGTVELRDVQDADALRTLLAQRITQAVIGTSRLPLTSVEAPLPEFTLGEFAYFLHARAQTSELFAKPMYSPQSLIGRVLEKGRPWPEKARLLETLLRSTPLERFAEITAHFVTCWQRIGEEPGRMAALLRTVFDAVALSPYTDFVDRSLAFLDLLESQGHWSAEEHADFLAGLLRQLVRHLTAYDLVTFHHRGANYPDALLLDAALKSLLGLAERNPALFAGSRLRRRAIRQAVLVRLWYEGHPVPDHPTSPGENQRVLPPAFPRVPEEQFTDPSKRRRKLFDADPLLPRLTGSEWFRQCLADLDHPAELQELGLALFLDRPFGTSLRPGEPDTTPLLSYEAFSRKIAERRLHFLEERVPTLASADRGEQWRKQLHGELPRRGLPLQMTPVPMRPGVASLADAFRVADDFVLLATTRRAVEEFLTWGPVAPFIEPHRDLFSAGQRLLVVGGPFVSRPAGTVAIFDEALRLRMEIVRNTEDSLHSFLVSRTPPDSTKRRDDST